MFNLDTAERINQIKSEIAKANQEDPHQKCDRGEIRQGLGSYEDDVPGASSSTDRPRIKAIKVIKVELEQKDEGDEVKKFRVTLAAALSLSLAAQGLFGKCAKRNKVQKIEEPEADDTECSDEFELVSNEAEEAPHQGEAGEELEDDFGIEEDNPVEKAKMIRCLNKIKEQIKDRDWEEKKRTRRAEAEKQRKQKDHCLKLI